MIRRDDLRRCTCRCKGKCASVRHDEGACWGSLRNRARCDLIELFEK